MKSWQADRSCILVILILKYLILLLVHCLFYKMILLLVLFYPSLLSQSEPLSLHIVRVIALYF